MATPEEHRRRVKHYHDPGDFHELTFSCYGRMPLLTNDTWRSMLAEALRRALAGHDFALAAFVFMPEHVHLLVYPHTGNALPKDIEAFLAAVKRPYSYRVKQMLSESRSPLLAKLSVARPRRPTTFRYWEKGPGYDRNLHTEKAVLASLDYIHMNPVTRGLCLAATDWRWSSARWYATDGCTVDPAHPPLAGIPADFF